MGMAMKGRRILLVGLAYKANVDDDRESPGYVLMDKMSKLGVSVSYFDPYIPVIRPSRAHSHWAGVQSVTWSEDVIGSFDAVLISTAHANVDYAELGQWANLIIDTRNAMKGIASRSKIVKA
jgi:UDP-N-acetyl-D-glucosamine dehydrogenase